MAAVGGGMWIPFKEILATIETAIVHRKSEVYAEFDEVLTKYKSVFVNLLKNPTRNTNHREQVKKASTTGLKLDGQTSTITLRESLVQDVLLLSDALELNELSCVELFLAGELQSPNFPGIPDPAICALLYHDGRRCILAALKLLLTARPGVTWTLELDDRIIELLSKFTEHLLENGLVSIILRLLEELSLPKELKRLEDAHALSEGKHKNMITELIMEQQLLLGDCLFAAACQFPLDKNDCEKLMNYAKLVAPNTADGSLDVVTIRVLFSLLASFNCDIMDVATENIEDAQYQQLPFFKNKTYFNEIHKIVIRPDDHLWQTPSLKHTIQFCWSIFLRTCSAHPDLTDFEEIFEEDDETLNVAVANGVFQFLRKNVIENNKFYQEEYFVKIMHSFITSLIVKFPMKIKDWRNSGDENARIVQAHILEGMEPPRGLSHDFKDFMDLVCSLYKKDPLGLQLNCEYWIPPEPMGGVFSPQPLRKMQQAMDQKKLMLNKFVRLAGDILLQTLYVSYIDMLAALSNNEQSSSYCFRLLSKNEHSGNSPVSWDHFFNSIKQYYISLRSTPDAADHRAHMHRHQGISPEELVGLESVLRLIKCVADNNESVRIAFCENQTWLPVASLLGLVCCSVPPSLKGLLLETLAAFAKSPEVAVSLWHSLEAAQVLQTQESGTQKSGIAVELLEIESRNESYPQTRAFIKLIDVLTDIAVPGTLGAGSRVPGFHPYLNFLTEDIFLSFKTRAYQEMGEKWRIGSQVLKIFLKILKDYTPHPDHFTERFVEMQGINFGKASKPSGFQLTMLLLNDTPLFRMVLAIVDDVAQNLEGFIPNDELKSVLEEISGQCMAILESVLEKQAIFIELAKMHMSSLILSPLDDLLLSVNPRTGKPDYLFIIARYMTYANVQPSIALSAIKIMKLSCEGLRVQKEIVDILAQNEIASRELLVGFAEHLEVPDPESEEDPDNFDAEDTEDNTEKQDLIRQNIVQLLILTMHQPSINLSQFLLGFDIRQPLSRTTLQDPGVKGFPKTCLHSIVTILNRGVANPMGAAARLLTPKLSESLYRLMYLLCAHLEMGAPIRRYLRTNTDFYMKHIQALPFLPTNADVVIDEIQYIRLANQQSWFLKTVAIDLRVVATSRMRSALQQLLGALYNEHAVSEMLHGGTTSDFSHQRTLEATQVTIGDSLSRTMLGSAFRFGSDESSLMMSLLSSVTFAQRYPPNIELQFFDYGAVEQLITSCEELDEMGIPLCNVRKLYKVLMNEINGSQLVVGASQKQEIFKEVRGVLKHAVDRNIVRESFHSKHNAFDSWRQVVEITFAICPADIIPVDKKQSILIEILEQLIPKMSEDEALPELTSAVAGTILSLMANLWFTCTQIDSMKHTGEISPVSMATICSLFPGIIEGIIAVGGTQARMRANLYGAFLYYTQIGQMYNSITKEGDEDGIFGKQSKENWETKTMEILYKYGDSFLDIVAKDMCQGTCIARMMAMSVFDATASLDWKHKYLMLMTSRGYLRVLVDQLLEEDVELQSVLSLQPQSMKPLYLFESKMSFLAKVASTDYGAQTLLQFGLISRLTECQFLDFHVEKPALLSNSTMGYTHAEDPFLPSLLERYSKIFSSFARLMLSFLSSVGIHHQVAISQVQNLVMNHEDVFHTILNDGGNAHSMTSLKQLSLAIAIVSLLPITDKKDDAWEILTEEQRRWRTFMNRVHRLMLSLLNKYSMSACKKILDQTLEAESTEKSFLASNTNHMNVVAVETQNALLQIRSRVLTFCKNVIASQGLSGPYARVMFAPSFTDDVGHETRLITGKPVSNKQLPNLSLIVDDLKFCPSQLTKCFEHIKLLDRKIESLGDMPSDDLREIICQEADSKRLPFQQRQVVALRILKRLKELRQNEANCLSYIIEHTVYIIWRHVDYYYLHCVPTEGTSVDNESSRSTYRRARHLNASDSSYISALGQSTLHNQSQLDQSLQSGVRRDEINELKAECPKILTDKLWQTILDADKVHGNTRSRLSFLSSLVRRIQSIVKLNS